MDDTTLGKIFQEISDDFTDMEPCSLDDLEDKVLTVIYKLGSYLKLRGMRWSRKGADAVLAIRILVCNDQWDSFWKRYKAA